MSAYEKLKTVLFGASEPDAMTVEQSLQQQQNTQLQDIKAQAIAAHNAGNIEASGGFSDMLTGDKFLGGFGDTKVYAPDYWTLRARSEIGRAHV